MFRNMSIKKGLLRRGKKKGYKTLGQVKCGTVVKAMDC